MSLISAKGIKKSYAIDGQETSVLKGIDLEIAPRALMSVVGSSGAGKSTLLHILSSLDEPTEGSVTFDGKDLYARSDAELSRLRNEAVGFVFQFHHLLPEFTALENAALPLLVRGEAQAPSLKKSLELLERLGLRDRAHHRPTELSGGEQQRVAVARALATSPRIVFADEPTGNLDQANGDRLIDLLFELHREKDMALVLVTHNSILAERFPQRIRLEDGRIVSEKGGGRA